MRHDLKKSEEEVFLRASNEDSLRKRVEILEGQLRELREAEITLKVKLEGMRNSHPNQPLVTKVHLEHFPLCLT